MQGGSDVMSRSFLRRKTQPGTAYGAGSRRRAFRLDDSGGYPGAERRTGVLHSHRSTYPSTRRIRRLRQGGFQGPGAHDQSP